MLSRIIATVFLTASLPGSAITVEVRHWFGEEMLRTASLRYQTPGSETFSITRLSYLLSGFETRDLRGNWKPLADHVAFIDFTSGRSSFDLPIDDSETLTGLRFAVGLDPEANHANPAAHPPGSPLDPNQNALHWNWKQGYIFMAIEGRYRERSGDLGGFVFHLANDWNRVPVELEMEGSETNRLVLDLDVKTLFGNPVPVSFEGDGNSTHSGKGDRLAGKLVSNLSGAFKLEPLPDMVVASKPVASSPRHLPENPQGFPFRLASGFPRPLLPTDNPLLKSRVALGEILFHDPSLSRTGEISCSSCHQADSAFSDPRQFSEGVDGLKGRRHSMPLFNLAWKSSFFWDGRARSLREQVLEPLAHPNEMGETMPRLVAKVGERYPAEIKAAFGTGDVDGEKISLALENYLLTLTSYDSKFDRAMSGKAELSETEKRGFELFFTEYEPRAGKFGADCFHCHGGVFFSDHRFHNNGLPPLDPPDRGLAEVTGSDADAYKFATPSLRNIALTAPYMHDGRFFTLEDVIAHYSGSVHRSETLDANLAKHPSAGLRLGKADQAALVDFLKALTDPKF